MKQFISQTSANEDGDYTITYINLEGKQVTKAMNLFNV